MSETMMLSRRRMFLRLSLVRWQLVLLLLPILWMATAAVAAFSVTTTTLPHHHRWTTTTTSGMMMMARERPRMWLIPLSLMTTTTDGTVDNWSTTSGHHEPPPAVPAVQVVHAMPPPLPGLLHNTYLLLRHGLSTANVDAIISSNRYDLAYTDRHGLTETGYEQGRQAAHHVLDQVLSSLSLPSRSSSSNDDDDPQHPFSIVFVSSPFARARQTASACREGLRQQLLLLQQPSSSSSPIITVDESIYIHPGLMERSFGRLDGEAIETYAYVWPLDRFNMTHTAFDVESVAAVCHRFRQCILDLEESFPPPTSSSSSSSSRTIIVLTSHADVLQIAQLYAANVPNVGGFSSYRFKNGEVRKMVLNDPSSLPDPSPLEKPDRSTKQG